MPLASLLETNKPFVFTSSHSNGSSTELAPPSSAMPSLPRQVNNTPSSPPPAAILNHTKGLPSSPLDRGHYHASSTISNEYNDDSTASTTTTIMEATNQQPTTETLPSYYNNGQPSRPNGIGSHSLSSTTGTKALLHDHTTHISPSTPTTHNNNSQQLLSPSTTDAVVLPTATAMTTSHNSSPPPSRLPQQHSSNTSLLFTSPHLQDSAASLPAHNGPTNHNVPSPRQSLPPVDPLQQHHHLHHHHLHHHQQQQEDRDSILSKHSRPLSSPLLSPSTITGTASATPPSLPPPSSVNKDPLFPGVSQSIVPPPPLLSAMATTIPSTFPTSSTTKRVTGQHNEGDSGYFDNSATENRRVKRRKELNQRIDGLTNDFNQNRESQAHNNTHQHYKDGLLLLESIRQKTLDHGQLFRDYQTQVTDRQFTLEIRHAEEEYLAERNEVREKLFAVLEEKRRKLKEDKDNCDLAYDVVLESQTRMNKRSLRKRGMENGDGKVNKRKQLSDILFM
ncbi:hypothetical protein [Absidia glauca]|uniref:Uncharacterized protein n=1 Tax=Absidia glauca TaxID=4829 RepID=A0A163JIV0_ABSGL|nr:hypothetical protein [Absidia glauca]